MLNAVKAYAPGGYVAGIVILAVALGILPPFTEPLSGDIVFQHILIRCFSEQFWQGDLYPRWCFAANDGLGAPTFVLYFPAAFYVTAIFYPLTWLGLDHYHFYIFMLLLVTLFTCFTAYTWLKDIFRPDIALMASLLFLFVPYRFEAIYFRAAFAEAWGIALLPLVFLFARRIARGKSAWFGYSISLAALVLTHVPLAVVAGIFSALYLLFLRIKPVLPMAKKFAAGALLAGALTAFYTVPAHYYKSFTHDRIFSGKVWANTYFSADNIFENKQVQIAITISLSLIVLTVLAVMVMRWRSRIQSYFLTRETTAMVGLFFTAAFLLFPLSAPFYEFTRPLSDLVFPWRMQAVFVLCFAYFLGILMQYGLSQKQQKTWRTDFVILMCFMVLASWLNIGASAVAIEETNAAKLKLNHLSTEEYRTRWMDSGQVEYLTIENHSENPPPRVAYVKGKGKVSVNNWGWDGITITAQTKQPARLRIDHRYFPTWKAASGQQGVSLSPEQGSGLMLLDIPAGETSVHIAHDITAANRPLLLSAIAVSVVAAFFVLGLAYRRSRALQQPQP